MNKKIIITGTMGSGKSSVLNAISKDEHDIVPECARTILAEQRAFGGSGVPDKDPSLFCELLLSRTLHQYKNNKDVSLTIYDRGLPDIIGYAKWFNLELSHFKSCAKQYRYNNTVFLLEPWQEIYVNDDERKMTFKEAELFHDDLVNIYKELNYELLIVPKASIQERVAFIYRKLGFIK